MTGQSNLKDHFVLVILVFLFLGSGILLINKFFWDGYLIIESNVLGSKISIDGKHYGDSPLYLGVSPGLHKLKVESSDHAAHIENFKINGGETKKLSVFLQRIAKANESEVQKTLKKAIDQINAQSKTAPKEEQIKSLLETLKKVDIQLQTIIQQKHTLASNKQIISIPITKIKNFENELSAVRNQINLFRIAFLLILIAINIFALIQIVVFFIINKKKKG